MIWPVSTRGLDYLRELGIDLIWVTPYYPSPMADFGYDVSDYCDVDPLFGSIRDFDRLLAEAHDRGLRVVIDLVPKHCSSQHPWFREAVEDRDSPYRDYFIWRPPAADGGPPNNWRSCFGGSAWTLEPLSGEYYLHLFLAEQPDLDWGNPAVEREFVEILEFWLERDVDGFRIDVAHALVKDLELRDNVQHRDMALDAPRREQWNAFDHLYDIGQAETLDIYRRWRKIVEVHDAVLIGETYALDAVEPETMISWISSSHDDRSAATRFGGGDVGTRLMPNAPIPDRGSTSIGLSSHYAGPARNSGSRTSNGPRRPRGRCRFAVTESTLVEPAQAVVVLEKTP